MAGCAPQTYQSAPVDAEIARDTLTHVLDAWRSGQSIESLRGESPAVVVQDFDWMRGDKLVEYQILGPGQEANANLIAKVRLVLQRPDHEVQEQTVTYLVGTAPTLTVFRDIFH
ncbi:MAG: hypothetical protein JSS02_23095 [Planctomycetes bacterium]|nr:hypothetical protein [Planctomycetota bacterium]